MSRYRSRRSSGRRGQPPPTPVCPICGLPASLTDEDMVPLWLRRTVFDLYPLGPKEQAMPRATLRICHPCNRQLKIVFEDHVSEFAKPMVRGQPILLSPRQQVILGSWAAKTGLIISLSDTRPGHLGREETRELLVNTMSTGLPPVQTSVRIMRIEKGPDTGERGPIPHLLPSPPPRVGWFGCFSFGYMALELLMGSPDQLLPFIARTQDDDWFIRVWPPDIPQQRKVWPPPQSLRRSDYRRLKQAWIDAQAGRQITQLWQRVDDMP